MAIIAVAVFVDPTIGYEAARQAPWSRYGHLMWYREEKIYVAGGLSSYGPVKDIWVFEESPSAKWTMLDVYYNFPVSSATQYAYFESVDCLFVWSGCGGGHWCCKNRDHAVTMTKCCVGRRR